MLQLILIRIQKKKLNLKIIGVASELLLNWNLSFYYWLRCLGVKLKSLAQHHIKGLSIMIFMVYLQAAAV